MKVSEEVLRQARDLIASRLGLEFPDNRRADLERGLLQACGDTAARTASEYLAWLASLPEGHAEWTRLAGHLTVGETYFFRDRAVFEGLEQSLLPSLIERRRADGTRRLRFWSAACATGEEPYSLAMTLARVLPDLTEWSVTILATDISPTALDAARRGCYREWSFRDAPPWIRPRYFTSRGRELYEIDPRIRRMVTIAPLNLAGDAYPSVITNTSAMDLILCRNVLMYFTRSAQREVVMRLQAALVAGGWLAVSAAEASVEHFRPLTAVNLPGAVFYRKESDSSLARESLVDAMPLVAPDVPATTATGVGELPLESPAAPSALPAVAPVSHRESELERARALANRGNLDGARELCEAALARDRLDAEAHLLLAAIHQERGETDAALTALRRAVYLASDSAAAHFLLGSLLLRQGHPGRGRRSMETVVRLLSTVPQDEPVAGSDGLSAGRLLETARAYLESP